jgi:hypothetical protein
MAKTRKDLQDEGTCQVRSLAAAAASDRLLSQNAAGADSDARASSCGSATSCSASENHHSFTVDRCQEETRARTNNANAYPNTQACSTHAY